jgi:hypothetical protein
VAVAGSNGYNKKDVPINSPLPSPSGYTGPIEFNGAINAPNNPIAKINTFMGYKKLPYSADQTVADRATYCTGKCTNETAYRANTLLRIQVKGRRFATRLLCMFSAKMMCLKRSNVLSTQRSGHQITQPTQGNIVGRLAMQSLRQLHTLMLLMRLSMLLYVRRKDALSPEGSYHGGNYGGYGSGNVSNSSSEGVVFSSGPTSLKPTLGVWW